MSSPAPIRRSSAALTWSSSSMSMRKGIVTASAPRGARPRSADHRCANPTGGRPRSSEPIAAALDAVVVQEGDERAPMLVHEPGHLVADRGADARLDSCVGAARIDLEIHRRVDSVGTRAAREHRLARLQDRGELIRGEAPMQARRADECAEGNAVHPSGARADHAAGMEILSIHTAAIIYISAAPSPSAPPP